MAIMVLLKVDLHGQSPAGTLRTIFLRDFPAFFACTDLALAKRSSPYIIISSCWQLFFSYLFVFLTLVLCVVLEREAQRGGLCPIGMNTDQSLNIILNLPSKIPFNDIFRLQKSVNPCDFISESASGVACQDQS